MPVKMACAVCGKKRGLSHTQVWMIRAGTAPNRCRRCAETSRYRGDPKPPPGAKCRHCGVGKMNRARGLCFRCSLDPAIRALYPTTSPYARRGSGTDGSGAEPPVPTIASPGTWRKLAVMRARAEAGLALHRDGDEQRLDGVTPEELLPRPPCAEPRGRAQA